MLKFKIEKLFVPDKFINETRVYPAEAYNNRIQGRVVCSFVVYPDGSINGISVMKGVEETLDREAVRIISEMPRWIAGCIGNEAVPVSCVLAIQCLADAYVI